MKRLMFGLLFCFALCAEAAERVKTKQAIGSITQHKGQDPDGQQQPN